MTRYPILVLLLLLLPPAPTLAQPSAVGQSPAVIESADVVGLPRDGLSAELRAEIEALAGTPLDRDRLAALAARIDAEQPELAAAVRDVPQPDGRVRVIFVVTRIGGDETLAANINMRYTVDRVEIRGIDEERIGPALRDDLHALAGRPLEDAEVDRLSARLAAEWPDHEVSHRVSRGDDQGRVRVTFLVKRAEGSWWIPFQQNASKLVYHRDLGWSGVFDVPIGTGSNRITLGLVAGNDDDLVEGYSGYSLRFENREAGTRRLGVSLELSRHTQKWRTPTLAAIAADPTLPQPYERRIAVTPTVTVAVAKDLRVTGGITSSQLDALPPADWPAELSAPAARGGRRATATLTGVAFEHEWRSSSDIRHRLVAGFDWQSGAAGLDSDYVYDRHSGVVRYSVSGRDSGLTAEFRAGRLTGDAPMFARFTLGDTHSLRGWNKYALAAAGAERMVHQSVQYRYKHFLYFVDAGSVWRPGEDRRLRLSTGIGIETGGSFITLGVPLNADAVAGKVLLGFRAAVTFDAGWLR